MTLLRERLGRPNLDSSRFYLRFLLQIQLYILAAPLSTILVLSVMVGWIVSHQSCEFFKQIVGLVDFSLLQNISSYINHKKSSCKPNSRCFFYFSNHSFNTFKAFCGGGGESSVLCAGETKNRSNAGSSS